MCLTLFVSGQLRWVPSGSSRTHVLITCCTWRQQITSQMVDRIDEKLIGERARLLSPMRSVLRVLPKTIAGDRKVSKRAYLFGFRGLVALVGSVMSPCAAPMNSYPRDVPSVRIRGDPSAPNGACETVSKKISGQMGGSGRSASGFHGAKTPHLQVFRSALGRTRTCDLLIRRPN